MERIVRSEVMMTFRCSHRNFRCNNFFKLHETKIVTITYMKELRALSCDVCTIFQSDRLLFS